MQRRGAWHKPSVYDIDMRQRRSCSCFNANVNSMARYAQNNRLARARVTGWRPREVEGNKHLGRPATQSGPSERPGFADEQRRINTLGPPRPITPIPAELRKRERRWLAHLEREACQPAGSAGATQRAHAPSHPTFSLAGHGNVLLKTQHMQEYARRRTSLDRKGCVGSCMPPSLFAFPGLQSPTAAAPSLLPSC